MSPRMLSLFPLPVALACWGAGAQPQYKLEVLPGAVGLAVPCLVVGRGRHGGTLIASASCFESRYFFPVLLPCLWGVLGGSRTDDQHRSQQAAGYDRASRPALPDEPAGRAPQPGAAGVRRA
jgi:hypothetical protein